VFIFNAKTMPPFQRKKIKPLNRERLEFLALRYITRYAATQAMLARVLNRHIEKAAFQNPDFVKDDARHWRDAILKRYVEKNWINDGDIAKRFVEYGPSAGLSRQKMQQKLMHKGIGKELIHQTFIDNANDKGFDEMDFDAARIFAKKKSLGMFRKNPNADPKKELAKLCRAGFSLDVALKTLKMTLDED
jgi:regulatory protein